MRRLLNTLFVMTEDAYLALVDQMEDACREHGMR